MSIRVPQDVERRVRHQISSGAFTSSDDVLREALDVLEKCQSSLAGLQQMVARADSDIAAGRVGEFDRDETKRAVRERLAARSQSD